MDLHLTYFLDYIVAPLIWAQARAVLTFLFAGARRDGPENPLPDKHRIFKSPLKGGGFALNLVMSLHPHPDDVSSGCEPLVPTLSKGLEVVQTEMMRPRVCESLVAERPYWNLDKPDGIRHGGYRPARQNDTLQAVGANFFQGARGGANPDDAYQGLRAVGAKDIPMASGRANTRSYRCTGVFQAKLVN